jgi:myo-inositol-1-phosphate synthase
MRLSRSWFIDGEIYSEGFPYSNDKHGRRPRRVADLSLAPKREFGQTPRPGRQAMVLKRAVDVEAAKGKLGVLIPGLGAVATTYMAGVFAARKGLGKMIGSLCEMGTIRLGKRTDDNVPKMRDYVSLAAIDDLVFGGWDIFDENAYDAAVRSGVLERSLLEQLKDELGAIRPMSAVFEQTWVKRLNGTHVKKGANKLELAEQVMEDIRRFKRDNGCDRLVMVWCGSTEVYRQPTEVHATLESFEAGLRASDDNISPSQIYAYAALKLGVPYANGAPNLTVDTPALLELARQNNVPIAGKDFKTGQTLMKTVLAPMLKARMLGLAGWYSTNILGNRDGEVLDDPESFKSKEVSKLGVLEHILQPDKYPDLYQGFSHVVRINYYPPRGDNKEGWDNIDIVGWLGYPMQIKVNFLCRDSILAAPIVHDLVLFMDFAQRAKMSGIQEWLSFYWKSPQTPPGLYPEHDLFIQLMKLKNTLRWTKGDDLITHLGAEYYD